VSIAAKSWVANAAVQVVGQARAAVAAVEVNWKASSLRRQQAHRSAIAQPGHVVLVPKVRWVHVRRDRAWALHGWVVRQVRADRCRAARRCCSNAPISAAATTMT
jgi:hypothetical protein